MDIIFIEEAFSFLSFLSSALSFNGIMIFLYPSDHLCLHNDIFKKQAMVDIAKEVGADAVSHGCTGKGNDQACLMIEL